MKRFVRFTKGRLAAARLRKRIEAVPWLCPTELVAVA